MGSEGLLVLFTIVRMSAPVRLDVTHLDEKPLVLDARVDEPPAKQLVDLQLELRDNSLPGEWARQEDYELVATRGRFSVAANNHFIVRNTSEAQVVASFAIEY